MQFAPPKAGRARLQAHGPFFWPMPVLVGRPVQMSSSASPSRKLPAVQTAKAWMELYGTERYSSSHPAPRTLPYPDLLFLVF